VAFIDDTTPPDPEEAQLMARLLAAEEALSIAVIATYWAGEIGGQYLTPRQLAMRFMGFVLRGGADTHPGAVLAHNLREGQIFARSGREWHQFLSNKAPKWRSLHGQDFDQFVWYVISKGLIKVHRHLRPLSDFELATTLDHGRWDRRLHQGGLTGIAGRPVRHQQASGCPSCPAFISTAHGHRVLVFGTSRSGIGVCKNCKPRHHDVRLERFRRIL
jgi:hypothetical protein